MASLKKLWKRHKGKAVGTVVGGPVGFAAGASRDAQRPGLGGPTNEVRDKYGNLLYGEPDVGIDPATGMPRDLPTGKQAPGVQHAADIWTRRFQLQQGEAASDTLDNALQSISTYRPGSAAARASGLFGQAAQTHLARGQMIQSPYLLYWADRDAQMKAGKAAKRAGYAQIAGQVIGTVAGAALGGPVGAGVGNQLGGALGNQLGGGTQTTAYGGLTPEESAAGHRQEGQGPIVGQDVLTPDQAAWQGWNPQQMQQQLGAGNQGGGPQALPSMMQGSGGAGPRAQEPPKGPQVQGPAGPRPGGGPGGPMGGPGGPQQGPGAPGGGPQAQGGPGQQMGMGGGGMGMPAITPSFQQTAMRYGADPAVISALAMEIDPTLDPDPWLDSLENALEAMLLEDQYESPFADVLP